MEEVDFGDNHFVKHRTEQNRTERARTSQDKTEQNCVKLKSIDDSLNEISN
jgi:hypothetical protein